MWATLPIALGDLKTIIAIERELQRIQELYFSGTPFEGESLDNFNDLLDQVQASGITLNAPQTLAAGSGTRVANVGDIDTLSLGGSGTADIDRQGGGHPLGGRDLPAGDFAGGFRHGFPG